MKDWFRFEEAKDVEFIRINLPGVVAVFSTRHGGVSRPPFESLNMAFHVGDDSQDVAANRQRFAGAVGVPLNRTVCAQQVHGTNIKVVSSEDWGKGVYNQEEAIPETDAMITAEKDVILEAFFADCVPVYLVDPVKGVVGLAHAGWKGTINGIAGKTVLRMSKEFGCSPWNCFGFIGPSIGPCCYYVGEEVLGQVDLGQGGTAFPVIKKQGKLMLDLWAANKNDLVSVGLLPGNIGIAGICTRCDTRFFSYRRDGGITGRMAALISLLKTEG